MFASLRKLDPRARETSLAALSLDLLPNARSEDDIADDRLALFEDVCREAGVNPKDRSPEARRRLQAVLSNALRKTILDPSRIKDIRARVGHQGFLPISQYELKFGDLFRNRSARLGVSQQLASATIRRSQFVRHLLPEKFEQPEGAGLSLFLVNKFDVHDQHSVVIFAIREGDKLRVDAGWLVFHSEIRPCDLSDPLDVLKALIDRYGLFIAAGHQRSKFILYEIVPIFKGDNQIIRIDDPIGKTTEFDAMFSFRLQRLSAEIAIAFAIDVTAYAADLRRHSVHGVNR